MESFIPAWMETFLTTESRETLEILSIRCSMLTPDQEKIFTFSSSEVDMTSAWIPLTKDSPKKMFEIILTILVIEIGLNLLLHTVD